jgi:hypothetical protein
VKFNCRNALICFSLSVFQFLSVWRSSAVTNILITKDLVGTPLTNTLVTFQPLRFFSHQSAIVALVPWSTRTDSAGAITNTTTIPGEYRVTIHDKRIDTPFTNCVWATNIALFVADPENLCGAQPATITDQRYPSIFGSNIVTYLVGGRRAIAGIAGGTTVNTNVLATTNQLSIATNDVATNLTAQIDSLRDGTNYLATNLSAQIARGITTFTNIARMIAGTPTNVCYVRGYSAAPVGGGFFELQPTNGLTTNMGWVFRSADATKFWVRQADVITPYQFGAAGNLTVDDTASFNNAMIYAASVATSPGKLARVTVPNGRFYLVGSGGGLIIPDGVELIGTSRAKSICYIVGLFTNDVVRVAEKDDGNANTHAAVKIAGLSFTASSLTGTNIFAINLTGHRNSRIEDLVITGEAETGPLSAFLLSDTNQAGGHESCFFNNIKNTVVQNVRGAIVLRGSFNDIANNSFSSLSIVSSNFLDTSGFGNAQAKLGLQNIYAASALGGADVLGTCPSGISAVSVDLEGYAASGCIETLGITQTAGTAGKSRLGGLVVPSDSILSLLGYTPLMPDVFGDEKFFLSGFSSVSADSTTVLRVNGGVAYNVHRYATAQENTLTVSNNGLAHVEYVYISTNHQPSGVLRLMKTLATNGTELVIAEVGVSSSGTIDGITNIVARQTLPRITARSLTTAPRPGTTNDAAALKGTNGVGLTVKADGKVGIGTNNPMAQLHVAGDLMLAPVDNADGRLRITNVTSIGPSLRLIGRTNDDARSLYAGINAFGLGAVMLSSSAGQLWIRSPDSSVLIHAGGATSADFSGSAIDLKLATTVRGNAIASGTVTATNGFYAPSNSLSVAVILAGMTNGGFWMGALSNKLMAVGMSNNAATFTTIAPLP